MFIHEIFKNADPKSLAMTGESNVTYGQLEKAVENYRNTLHAMGIRRGDTVGLYTANRAEFVYVYMAVVSLGAIIECIDGPIAINHCLANEFQCTHMGTQKECDFHRVFSEINRSLRDQLCSITMDRFLPPQK